MRPELTAGPGELRLIGVVGRGLRGRTAVAGRAEYYACRVPPALPTGTLLYRESHRGGEHEQGQPEAADPVKKRAFHIRRQRYDAGGMDYGLSRYGIWQPGGTVTVQSRTR